MFGGFQFENSVSQSETNTPEPSMYSSMNYTQKYSTYEELTWFRGVNCSSEDKIQN